jgi:DNA-binding transcriptional regulator Cro
LCCDFISSSPESGAIIVTPTQVVAHFGSQKATAAAIGLSQPSVCNWVRRGHVPVISQIRLHAITAGALPLSDSAKRIVGVS